MLSLLESTSTAVGEEFFRKAAHQLATCLGVTTAFLSELVSPEGEPERLRTLALWQANAWAEPLEYDVADTPCGEVLRLRRPVHFDAVREAFPRDEWLAQIDASSYVAAPLMSRDGRLMGHVGVAHDATLSDVQGIEGLLTILGDRAAAELQRQRLERAATAQVAFRQAIIDATAEGICVCHDTPTFPFVTFTSWNKRMTEITGYTREEINAAGWYQSMYPDPDVQARAKERMDRMRVGDNLHAEEWTITRADQAQRVVQISTSALMDDPEAAHVIVLIQDVTERHEYQAELKRLRDFHEKLLNATSEGIAIFDSEQRWEYVNPAGAAMLGYTPDELIGLSGEETVMREDVGVMEAADERRARGVSDRYELVLRHRDGYAVPTLVSAVPWMDGEKLTGSLSMFTDLTALRRAEHERRQLEVIVQQSQRLESLGTLAGGIAHDFNNILSIILGFADIALDSMKHGESASEEVEEIVAAAHRARELVQQILMFGQRTEEAPRRVSLQPVVEEALRLLRQALPSTIEIRQKIDPDCPSITANSTQLHQVVVNLCTNAARAMAGSGGVLEVRLDQVQLTAEQALVNPELEPGIYARLTVRDSGVGISAATLQRLFEPYFTTREKGEGTGLGLAVVHGIVHSYGGAIVVDSQPGEGSTFSVYLPISLRSASVHPGPLPSVAPRGSEHVLCVDDEPLVAKVLGRILTSLGYEVTVVVSVAEAQAELLRRPGAFDLLLTDQTMPGSTGLELAAMARDLRPDLAVVICTGYRQWLDAGRVEEMEVQVLDKPVAKPELANAVRRALDHAVERRSKKD